ncbi:MAG: hypothetical protein WED11_02450 [Natronospirillum sp.]
MSLTKDLKRIATVNDAQSLLDLVQAGLGVGLINSYTSLPLVKPMQRKYP